MTEPIIADLVEIHSGYANAVSLKSELFDDTKNFGRMSRYRPIASHRLAFQKLARSMMVKDKRTYLLTGAYGTGKSHLVLMFANYMQTSAGEAPMPEFFGHYGEVDMHAADDLKNKRLKGRHLVALCEWGGKGDFDEIVLMAVDAALRRAGFTDQLDTIYLEALRRIQLWKERSESGESHLWDSFERELTETNAGVTIAQFKKKLSEFDTQTLDEFKRIHTKITAAPFAYDQSNLIDILTNTLRSEKFKDRFQGIVVLFDEFGDTLERGGLNPKAFQRFAELCEQTPDDCARLVFVATAHKNLTDYAKSYNSTEFRTASDRVEQVSLTPDGVEDIIAAIVVPQKQSDLWNEYVLPQEQTFDSFSTPLNRLKESHHVFDWLNTARIRQNIIENIYPMHPMATYCLLQLARDVASNNRSVFSFFSGDKETGGTPGSYTDYVLKTPIVTSSRLNLYTPDRLFEYFAETLKSDNKELRESVRNHIKNYENSLRTLNQVATSDWASGIVADDPLTVRLMKLMLIYEIVSIPNRADNLQFGLYCSLAEEQELKNRVENLVTKGVLYFNKDTSVYEFKNAGGADLDAMIEDYIKDTQNHPANLVSEVNALVPLGTKDLYLEAKNFNLAYSEDKRLEKRIVRPVDLQGETQTAHGNVTYFERLERDIADEIAKKGEYEGIALFVACEKVEDIAKARDICGRNQSDRIVVAIPKQPIPLFDAIMEMKALKAIEKSEARKAFTPQDSAALHAKLSGGPNQRGAADKLAALRDSMMDAKSISWLGKYANAIATDDAKPHDIANRVMETLYDDGRNKVGHDDFNKLHAKMDKKPAIREAVTRLVDYTTPLVIDTALAQSHGEIRYLNSVLLNHGALRVTKTEGSKQRCEVETDPAKFADKLPALAQMVTQIKSLGNGAELNLADWMRQYRQPPYGQGSFALVISLAYLRRRFGDSIRFKIDKSAVGDMTLRAFDDVLALSEGQLPNAFLSYRPLTLTEKKLAAAVYEVFGTGASAETIEHTVGEAYDALKNWWDKLPMLARNPKSHSDEAVKAFTSVMERVNARDAHSFLFTELPTAFGLDGAFAITDATITAIREGLPDLRDRLDHVLDNVSKKIVMEVGELFETQGGTYDDIRSSIAHWINSLDSGQRDVQSPWQNSETRPLIQSFGSISDLSTTLLTTIPTTVAYDGESVQKWGTDKSAEYLKKLKSAKATIDANRRKVAPAILKPEGDFTIEGKTISFHEKVCLRFEAPAPGMKIYVTEGNLDPTNPSVSRLDYNDADPPVVDSNKIIKFSVQDSEGNWSTVETVTLTNVDKKFEPSLGAPNMFTQERSTTFIFPKDVPSLKVTCRRLFELALVHNVASEEELRECLDAAYEEATKS